MRWKSIIFDRDGTLFDSFPVILAAFNHAVEPFREKRPTDEEWFEAFGPAEPEVIGKFIPEQNKQAATERFFRYYTEHSSDIRLFPGIREALERIKRAGCSIALFTGGGRESTRVSLQREGVAALFDLLVTGDDVKRYKPDPEGINVAISKLGGDLRSILVVGDAGADVIAGQKAGIQTALARWSPKVPPYDLPSTPDYTFYSVADFQTFLFGEEKP